MYPEENVKVNCGVSEPQKELDLIDNEIMLIIDTVANRVADFKQINDSLFGSLPEENCKEEVNAPNLSGVMEELKYKIETLRFYADKLMPEVKRLHRLI